MIEADEEKIGWHSKLFIVATPTFAAILHASVHRKGNPEKNVVNLMAAQNYEL